MEFVLLYARGSVSEDRDERAAGMKKRDPRYKLDVDERVVTRNPTEEQRAKIREAMGKMESNGPNPNWAQEVADSMTKGPQTQ